VQRANGETPRNRNQLYCAGQGTENQLHPSQQNGQVHSGQQDQDQRRAEAQAEAEAEAKSEQNSVRVLNSVRECSAQPGWNGIDGSSLDRGKLRKRPEY
jgi:hypothetical protein